MNDNITNSSATILAQKKLSNISVLTFRNIGTIEEGSSNFFGAKYTGIFVIYPGRVLFYSHPARCDTLSFKFRYFQTNGYSIKVGAPPFFLWIRFDPVQ